MQYLIICIICTVIIPIVKLVLKINVKQVKKFAENRELNEVTKSLPSNIQVCKSILKNIGNEQVQVENSLSEKSGTSLYMVLSNKILIANLKQSYTRFGTIAHECVHSIQNKTLHILHFILSNVYNILFLIIITLKFIYKNQNYFISMFLIISIGIMYFIIKFILEKDAILRSKKLAIDYLKSTGNLKQNKLQEIDEQYTKINTDGVNFIKFIYIADLLIRVAIYNFICFIL